LDERVTVDYDGEQAAPEPVSAVIAKFLRRSFSVADLFSRAFRGWVFGLVGLMIGLTFGVYTIWTTPPSYSVTIGLLPTDSGGGDILSSDSGSALGALAGLIGISGQPVPKFTRFVASLYATGVAKMMDKDHDMVCRTFSDCDIKTHTWRKHTGFEAWVSRLMASLGHLPDPDSPRTPLDLANYTQSQVAVTSDKTTHVLTLGLDSRDPKFAVAYLQTLVRSTNEFIKAQDREVIQQYVDYLNRKLATNTNVGQRGALDSLLLEQERRLMLTAVDVPYAASVQDGPNVESSNRVARVLLVDGMLGLVFGMGLGAAISLRSDRRSRSKLWTQS
jgi:hypothetical protein